MQGSLKTTCLYLRSRLRKRRLDPKYLLNWSKPAHMLAYSRTIHFRHHPVKKRELRTVQFHQFIHRIASPNSRHDVIPDSLKHISHKVER
jgi:hypothetical protein